MPEDKNFDQEILKKIKEEKITPKPKWQFLLKEYTVWGVGVFSLLIGALAFSVIIYMFINNDWGIYHEMDKSFLDFIVLTLPYFWLIFLGLFILLLNYNVRHTKKGYRYSLPIILMSSVTLSAALGVLFFEMGIGRGIDDILGERMPLYGKVINPSIDFWSQPEQGRLAGMVVEVFDDNIRIYDLQRHKWNVDSKDAEIMPMVEIRIGRPLRMTGNIIEDSNFKADKIFPAEGPGRKSFERGVPPMIMLHMDEMMKCEGDVCPFTPDPNLPLEINPEFRDFFSQELLNNQDMFSSIIQNEPRFLEYLKKIQISTTTLDQLQK